MIAGPLGVLSRGILRIPRLQALTGTRVLAVSRFRVPGEVRAIGTWGRRPGSERAAALARARGLPLVRLEDGFLRSVGLGSVAPPLSIVLDDEGIYYDAAAPSRLERLTVEALDPGQLARARALRQSWCDGGVSKYNAARDGADPLPEPYVLVADQTFGDASVTHGLASADSFSRMLEAALDENPGTTVVLKVHPDVWSGKSRGHFALASLPRDPRLSVLRSDMHPARLVAGAAAVYAVTSQLGFEALLWGRRVRVFGMPFYAGWGLTGDDLPPPRRRRPVALEQLVHAALCRYARYVDPDDGAPCSPERLVEHLALQRRMRERFPAEVLALGFSPWKRPLVRGFLEGSKVHFLPAAGVVPRDATVVAWGSRETPGVPAGSRRLSLEDGFLRSVGLGAELARPLSWAVDTMGMYYDASRPSLLEHLLLHTEFDARLLECARRLRARIVQCGLSKYNLGGGRWQRPEGKQRVVLVVGQVESDAAVRLGAGETRSNRALLEATRVLRPDAWLVFKPHPDVVAGLRRAGPLESSVGQLADEVVVDVSIASLLEAVDEVHVVSSLAGFEALLRGRPVVCHGQPFYSGWGLTEDLLPHPRRGRQLELDALVAAALVLYPTYRNAAGTHFIDAERALEELLALRSRHQGPVERLVRGLWRTVLQAERRLRG